MPDKIQNSSNRCDYAPPECTLIRLGKEDILTSSSIYLPMQPLTDDPLINDPLQLDCSEL